MAEQRREYYRVQYPVADRPVLSAKTGQFEVMDVSEFGVRFRQDAPHVFEPGINLEARIRFNDGYEHEFGGEILRCDADSVSVKLHKPISLRRIQAESVYLMVNYKGRLTN
ncbi:MAG: hypothetical protein QG652_1326 [Pseudomonadota bacterium]|nr:hypothetical protein [Pseudomonadota bacterium]